jgi:hypothetical protein
MPQQVMRRYIKNLDITVANLDNEMDRDCWGGNFNPIPKFADV